jgi:hypothetical protein
LFNPFFNDSSMSSVEEQRAARRAKILARGSDRLALLKGEIEKLETESTPVIEPTASASVVPSVETKPEPPLNPVDASPPLIEETAPEPEKVIVENVNTVPIVQEISSTISTLPAKTEQGKGPVKLSDTIKQQRRLDSVHSFLSYIELLFPVLLGMLLAITWNSCGQIVIPSTMHSLAPSTSPKVDILASKLHLSTQNDDEFEGIVPSNSQIDNLFSTSFDYMCDYYLYPFPFVLLILTLHRFVFRLLLSYIIKTLLRIQSSNWSPVYGYVDASSSSNSPMSTYLSSIQNLVNIGIQTNPQFAPYKSLVNSLLQFAQYGIAMVTFSRTIYRDISVFLFIFLVSTYMLVYLNRFDTSIVDFLYAYFRM